MNSESFISTKTQFCVVIGDPIGHSLSPLIHNAAFRELGLDFVYLACRVEDLEGALKGMKALGNFKGMSITIPHKIGAIDFVDELHEVDRHIGSINTVIKEEGKLIGFGTDGPGACKAITNSGFDPGGKNILMLGAGGASRAIAFTIADQHSPAKMDLLDINGDTAQSLASDINKQSGFSPRGTVMNEENLAASMEEADLIINCTPLGMHPDVETTAVPDKYFRKGQSFFDIVYNPLKTRLLKDAEKAGLNTISGVEMFVNQAVLQFEAFSGCDAPVEVMRRVVLEALEK